jgi:DNA-binding HxlR family transcriptional regulator
MSGTRYNQFCALARAAEIVGERWTLLIVRELLLSPMRFGDLRERLDDISPALLTDRLNALVEAGVVQRAALPAPFNAQVYELTETGRAIQPAIRELIRWGGRFLFPMRKGETFEPDWVLLALEAIARRTAVPQCRIGLRVPHPSGTAGFIIEGGPEGTRIAKGKSSGIASTSCYRYWEDICRSTRPSPVGRPRSRAAHILCASCQACLSLRQRSVDSFARVSGRSRRSPVRCLGSPNDGTCR